MERVHKMPEKTVLSLAHYVIAFASAFIGGFALWQSKRMDTLQTTMVSKDDYNKDQKLFRASVAEIKADSKEDTRRLEGAVESSRKEVLDAIGGVHSRVDRIIGGSK